MRRRLKNGTHIISTMPLTLQDLTVPTSGQFFGLAAAMTNAQVAQVFDDVGAPVVAQREANILREALWLQTIPYWCSFVCFPVEHPPPFAPNSQLRDRRFVFLLLIELQDQAHRSLGVFKAGIAGLGNTLEQLITPIARRSFIRAFSTRARYEKLSLRRMTVSPHELRASSYEAADLEVTLPSLAITRSVPRRLSLQHRDHGTISITVSSSRVHKSGPREVVAALARLTRDVGRESRRGSGSAFLDSFPAAIQFDEKPTTLVPRGVLIEWAALLDNNSLELRRTRADGSITPFRSKSLLRLLGGVLTTRKQQTEWVLKNETRGFTVGRLRENKRGYALAELLHQTVNVHSTDGLIQKSLTTWLREEQPFQIAFSSPDYFFSAGNLYKRAGFDREVDLVRSIMQPRVALANVNSEKGKPLPTSAAQTVFPPNSIFRFVEDVEYAQADYLWCTDLGDEWADYVVLVDDKLIFSHCKHGQLKASATPYQEVVGQALKNLGRAQAMPQTVAKKIKGAAAKNTWGNTGIVRLRGGKPWAAFEAAAIDRVSDPNAAREVHLVISMLSLAGYNAAATSKRPSFIQLVWLLASFMNSTREHGARPVIICRP